MTWESRIVGHGEEDPNQLAANPRNWRLHGQQQQDALKGVLDEVGWVQSVLVNQNTGFVVDGHLRVMLAMKHDQPMVPVVYVSLTEEEERLILATLDPLSAMAGTDKEVLAELLAQIGEQDGAVAGLLDDLSRNAGIDTTKGGLTDPDDVPDPPKKPVTKPGDLWVLGDHRLLCGDATEPDNYARCLAGNEDVLLLTDPPYGVSYSEIIDGRGNQKLGGWRAIHNDDLTGDRLESLLRDAFRQARAGTAFVWFGHEQRFYVERALTSCGFAIAQEIIWVKNALVMSRGADYHWRHEQAVYAKRKGHRRPPTRDQNTVWEVHKQTGSMHPTQKPVELYEIPMRNHTVKGSAVLDPFAGSGTLFIAAEGLERRGYGFDIDPAYCDVTVERWENFTGGKAVRE